MRFQYNVLYVYLVIMINSIYAITPLQVYRPPRKTTALRQQNNSPCENHAFGEFVRNPDDCRLFYLCMENGEAVIASCPPTMLFNPESKLCDSPANVNCDVATTVASVPTTNAPNQSTTSDNGLTDPMRYCASMPPQIDRITYIGSSSNCQQYYICYYGQALLQECSANLHWNARIGKCDLPANAACELENSTGNNPQQPSGNDGDGVANNPNNNNGNNNNNNNNNDDVLINCPSYGQHIYPHMDRCEYFIYCVKGNAILQQCPFYYHFDVVTKRCKWRTAAVCVRALNINFRKLNKIAI